MSRSKDKRYVECGYGQTDLPSSIDVRDRNKRHKQLVVIIEGLCIVVGVRVSWVRVRVRVRS
jgi:hypothetical protein